MGTLWTSDNVARLTCQIEGGRNLWPRPEVKKFDPETTAISMPIVISGFLALINVIAFQQIDIEEFPDASGTVVRMFGVTSVSTVSSSH